MPQKTEIPEPPTLVNRLVASQEYWLEGLAHLNPKPYTLIGFGVESRDDGLMAFESQAGCYIHVAG